MHIIAAKAVCFGEALLEFKDYQKNPHNRKALAKGLMSRALTSFRH